MNENTNTPAEPAVQPKSATQRKIEELIEDRKRIDAHIGWLKKHQATIDSMSIEPSMYCMGIDYDNANRSQILEVIKAFPGVWDKNINSSDPTKMDYVRRSTDREPRIRIWSGELPPTCKLVEEWVNVPAIPAARVRKLVVKCSETKPEPKPEMEPA